MTALTASREAPERAEVTVWTDIETVMGVISGCLPLREAVERSLIRLEGDAAALGSLLASDAGTGAVS